MDMYCPFCKSDDVRMIDIDFEFTPIFECFECKKIFQVETWIYDKEEGLKPKI